MFLLTPSLAQEGPSERFNSFLKTTSSAKVINDIKPFFSSRSWQSEFSFIEDASDEEKKEFLKDGLSDFQGWTVKKESVEGNKATVFVQTKDGKDAEILMIKENGSWVIDG